ncbi:MAG: oligosaccharide flippase family protein, partial [Flavobacterium sp.]|nr:oligosaccharide flippase family protein [Flavobacterium sp.]
MSLYKNLFKQTLIYGLATVLPRMLSFLLNPLYVKVLPKGEFGEISIVFAGLIFFNVILSYGMETSFFRFYNSEENKDNVVSTSTISIFWSSFGFLLIALLFKNTIADFTNINVAFIVYTILILVFDALAIVPFSKLRATKRPMVYAAIKIGSVVVNFGLNLFFLLLLPKLITENPTSFFNSIYFKDFQIGYIFISNLIASLLTLIVLIPNYLKIKWHFDYL